MWKKLSIVNNVCRETGCFREKSLTRCLSKVFHFVRLRKHFACSVYEGSAHNLGVFLDKQLSVSHHIANLRRNTHTQKKSAYFHPGACSVPRRLMTGLPMVLGLCERSITNVMFSHITFPPVAPSSCCIRIKTLMCAYKTKNRPSYMKALRTSCSASRLEARLDSPCLITRKTCIETQAVERTSPGCPSH